MRPSSPPNSTERTPLSAQAILEHPRFYEVKRLHVDCFITVFSDPRFMGDMIADWGRLMSTALLVALDAAYRLDDRATWPTPALVRKLVHAGGMASPRHIDKIISQFRREKYIEAIASPTDGRVRLLRPTEKMLVQDRAFIVELLRPLTAVDPDGRYGPAMNMDPAFQRAFRTVWMAALPRTQAMIVNNRPIAMLWARHAGYLALLLLVREMLRKNDQPGPPLTFQALAKTLDVSRTHVRKIFADAAAKGFVHVGGRGGHEVTILEPLRQAHDHWICEMGAGYDALTLQALALMERSKDALV